jgi:hypothetical protein
MTDRADAEGRHCMLEATSERSRRLYEKHGFECFQDFRASRKAPPVFFMMRAPRQAAPPQPPAAAAVAAAGRLTNDLCGGGAAGGKGGAAAGALTAEQQQLIRSLSAAKVAALVPALELEAGGGGDGDTIKASRPGAAGVEGREDCCVQVAA